MKVYFFYLIVLFSFSILYSQDPQLSNEPTLDNLLDSDTRIYLETNIDFATSSEDSRPDAQSGTGTLGIKFERKLLYGGINFTVYSKNNDAESESENDIKIFGSNLLIPSNSSESISSFSFLFGTKSFKKLENIEQDRSLLDISRIGAFINFSINNTTWILPDSEVDVTLTSLELICTYRLLTLAFDDQKNGLAIFSIEAGYSNRRLGGDYGLDINEELRSNYIGTDELGFDSVLFGARLEVSNFYGEVNLTNFGNKGISGFSGNQATINLGFNAQLNLKAKERIDAVN